MSHSNYSAKAKTDHDRLFIFSVRIPLLDGKSHKSSISMDGFLAECLIGALGNHVDAGKWVEARVIQIWEASRHDKGIRRAGVSRLVQREALKLVLKNPTKNET